MKLSFKIAFSGLMAALSTAIMLLAGFIPVFTYISPLLASVFLVPVIEELGRKWGWMTWITVSILSVILVTDKEAAFFYFFTGYYPMIKGYLDKIWQPVLKILAKLGVFAASIALMYLFLVFVLALPAVVADLTGAGLVMNIALFAVMVLILMCYDFILRYIFRYYRVRIKPKLRIRRR